MKTMQNNKKHARICKNLLYEAQIESQRARPMPTIPSAGGFREYFLRTNGSDFTPKPDFGNHLSEFFNVLLRIKMLSQLNVDRLSAYF